MITDGVSLAMCATTSALFLFFSVFCFVLLLFFVSLIVFFLGFLFGCLWVGVFFFVFFWGGGVGGVFVCFVVVCLFVCYFLFLFCIVLFLISCCCKLFSFIHSSKYNTVIAHNTVHLFSTPVPTMDNRHIQLYMYSLCIHNK